MDNPPSEAILLVTRILYSIRALKGKSKESELTTLSNRRESLLLTVRHLQEQQVMLSNALVQSQTLIGADMTKSSKLEIERSAAQHAESLCEMIRKLESQFSPTISQ
mmetsp:Transcript_71137/g.189889  ORF Transcript_71137/g.189889 Transcript_71137/m.189889 type:complete len:107 (-) Transcript_71137:529-849(-)